MGTRYFRDGSGYIGVTTVTPKGPLHGLVFSGRGPILGKGIESIHEQGYAKCVLAKLQPVSALDVPDDWFDAIALEQREPRTVEVVIEPLTFSMLPEWEKYRVPYLIWLAVSFLIACWLVLWR
jgi:hypothetical protein